MFSSKIELDDTYVISNSLLYLYSIKSNKMNNISCLQSFNNFKYVKLNDIELQTLSSSLTDKIKNEIITSNDIISLFLNAINVAKGKQFNIYNKLISLASTDINLINYINSINIDETKSVLNLCSGYGDLIKHLKNNNIYSYDIDDHSCIWYLINYYFKYNTITDNVKKIDVLHDNIPNNEYQYIICDIPQNIRNVIHAECCDRIKNLKIRGTKAEPLILQLIMTLLSKNSEAIVHVPSSLLHKLSNQHVETREYLINNFKIKKIITFENKNSILHFENMMNGETTNEVEIIYENNKIIKINLEQISKNNYSLYYENYMNISLTNNYSNLVPLKELINIIDTNNVNIIDTTKLDDNYLLIPKNVDEGDEIKIIFDNFQLNNNYSLIVKDNKLDICLQKYVNFCIKQLLNDKLKLITVGKLRKLDLEKFLNLEIPLPKINTQEIMVTYFELNYKLISHNNKQVILYNKLRNEYVKLMTECFPTISLKEICSISNKPEKINTIAILKNSNSAGSVILSDDKSIETNNIYYLNNAKINNEYLYYVLKAHENKLVKLANLTNTICLNRTNLDNFLIPVINTNKLSKDMIESEIDIVSQCKTYDNIKNSFAEINKTILSKNIIDKISEFEK